MTGDTEGGHYDAAITHRFKISILLGVLAALVVAAPASAGPPKVVRDHFTPLSARVLHAPEAVRGGDGLEHLVYELVIENVSTFPPRPVTVRDVIVKADGKTVQTLAGKQLHELMAPFGEVTDKTPRTTIQPGGTAKVLMDVTYPAGAQLPRHLGHELVVSAGPSGSIELSHFPTAPTSVDTHRALNIAPPLRGPGWVVINGCCDEYTSHRGSLLSINGTLHAGERYAIDFVQVDSSGHLTEGPSDVLANYPFYGDEVLSSTPGVVVAIQNGLPDGPIDFDLPAREAGDAGGNYVVVMTAPHLFAFYGHLIPGSIKVRLHQRVAVGAQLGLLGNSGNSNAPHLHFQLMDTPSPLGAEGIPYTFDSFTAEGRLKNFGPFFGAGRKVELTAAPHGPKHAQLPLNLQVVDFGQ